MFTVALIGADGAGKSTVARRLVRELPVPVQDVYMGINLEASTFVLPTTRVVLEIKRLMGGRPDIAPTTASRSRSRTGTALSRFVRTVTATCRLATVVAEEWFRQTAIWYHHWRGSIVLCDRHFFTDYYADVIPSDGAVRPLPNQLHGFSLKNLYPKPDLIICLDAPAEVLFARKGEGTVASLEERRQDYLRLRQGVAHFATVDATLPEDEVVNRAATLILNFRLARDGKAREPRSNQLHTTT